MGISILSSYSDLISLAMEHAPNWERWTSIITDVDANPEIFYWEATIVTDPDHFSSVRLLEAPAIMY